MVNLSIRMTRHSLWIRSRKGWCDWQAIQAAQPHGASGTVCAFTLQYATLQRPAPFPMPDLSATPLAQTLRSAAATVESLWDAIPGAVWIALYFTWIAGSVVYIIMQRRRPTATLAWIVGFIALPLLGAVDLLLLRPAQAPAPQDPARTGQALRVAPGAGASRTAARDARLAPLAEFACPRSRPPTATRRPSQPSRSSSSWRATAPTKRSNRPCAQARRQIHLEYYIFEPDLIGTRWRDLLVDKAREGVAVRLLVDALGSKNCKTSLLAPADRSRRRGQVVQSAEAAEAARQPAQLPHPPQDRRHRRQPGLHRRRQCQRRPAPGRQPAAVRLARHPPLDRRPGRRSTCS